MPLYKKDSYLNKNDFIHLVSNMKKDLLDRIVVNPEIMIGKPVIKGTRIPVDAIIRLIAQGMKIEEILKDYPRLKKRRY